MVLRRAVLIEDSTKVRLYEVGANGQTQGKAMYAHQGPVLSTVWNKASLGRLCSLVVQLTRVIGGEQVVLGGC